MEEYFKQEHADTWKKNPFARLIQANMAPSFMLPEGELGCPAPPALIASFQSAWRTRYLLQPGLLRKFLLCSAAAPSAKSDRTRCWTGGSREKESRHAAEVFYSLSSEVEPPNASLTIIMLAVLAVFCEIKVLLEGPQAQLLVQMLQILCSRSGFSSQTSELCRGTLTVQICEAEMFKYI